MEGEIYKEYGKRAEIYAEKKLLERGITKEQINKFKDSGRCLGCANPRNECQCAFCGSCHPSTQERIDWIERLIKGESK